MPRNRHETALEWLERVAANSLNPRARDLALLATQQWTALLWSWNQRGVKTRRSLWDLLSGILQVAHSTTHRCIITPVESGGKVFHFPIFSEACDYRGKAWPLGAVRTGIQVQAHRCPQTTKWGNVVLKT